MDWFEINTLFGRANAPRGISISQRIDNHQYK
jgi:hypothetical protein